MFAIFALLNSKAILELFKTFHKNNNKKIERKSVSIFGVYIKTGNILYQEQMKRKSDGDNGKLSCLIVKN